MQKIKVILISSGVAFLVLSGIGAVTAYRMIRFHIAESEFYNYARLAAYNLDGMLVQYAAATTPEQADAVQDALHREDKFRKTDLFFDEMEKRIERMTEYCPHERIGDLVRCVRIYKELDGAGWVTEMPFFYRNLPNDTCIDMLLFTDWR